MLGRMRPGRRVLAVAGAAIAGAMALGGTSCAVTTSTAPAPAYQGNLPDPSVFYTGFAYYAFGTQDEGGVNSNIQRVSSSTLDSWPAPAAGVAGEKSREALPKLPSWAVKGGTLAPEVIHIGSRWVMYYTVRRAADNLECISVATSATPYGTFVDSRSGPLICDTSAGGSIDPAPYKDSSGLYLYWKDNNATIYGQRLSTDGLSRTGSPVPLLSASGPVPTAWADGNIEAPALAPAPNGKYLLFYSGNFFDSQSYAVGYATCDSPLPTSGCSNATAASPWFSTTYRSTGPNGPGGQSFLRNKSGGLLKDANGRLLMAYHGWGATVGAPGSRYLWVTPIVFSNGSPVPPDKCWPNQTC